MNILNYKKQMVRVIPIDDQKVKSITMKEDQRDILIKIMRIIDVIMSIFSLLSVIIYIVSTYISTNINNSLIKQKKYDQVEDLDGLDWLKFIDYIYISIQVLVYLGKFYLSHHKLKYCLSGQSFVSILIIFPITFYFFNVNYLKRFLNISRVIRLFKFVKHVKQLFSFSDKQSSSVKRQITDIFITLILIIIVSTGIMYALQQPWKIQFFNKGYNVCKQVSLLYFHDMFYFVVVTLSTVGYGDIYPYSIQGRICIIALLVIVLVVVPRQTNELIRLMSMQSIYARNRYKSNPQIPFIILTGDINLNNLRCFCQQFFHPQHGNEDKHAIIICQKEPTPDLEMFLKLPQYELFLTYIEGNVMLQRDILKTDIQKANACIILSNQDCQDRQRSDFKCILSGLSIKKFVKHKFKKNIRLIIQLQKIQSRTHYVSCLFNSGDQLMVVDIIKLNLFAKSCYCPGIISLIGNLVSSFSQLEEFHIDKLWFKQYVVGLTYQIYRTKLSAKFQTKSFCQVASFIYNQYNAVLFALELEVDGLTVIRLNPGPYIIPNVYENNVYVYLICKDNITAQKVSRFQKFENEISKENMKKKEERWEIISTSSESEQEDQQENYDQLNYSDFELFKEDNIIKNIEVNSIYDSNQIVNHIIVCGATQNIKHFIIPLRAKLLPMHQYIIILTQQNFQDILEQIKIFSKVILIKGNPMILDDLHRANINFCSNVILFRSKEKKKKTHSQVDDSQTIFIYKTIKKINRNIQIFVDLIYESNLVFLQQKNQQINNDIWYFRQNYFSGQCYLSSLMDSLLCQAYYNEHIISIIQQILTGGKQTSPIIKLVCQHADLRQSNLFQIPVPQQFFNKTFGEFYNYLCLEKNMIALGLYRQPGCIDNEYAYTYTCPNPQTKLNHCDRVFVLGQKYPQLSQRNINFLFNKFKKQKNSLASKQKKKNIPASLMQLQQIHNQKQDMKIVKKIENEIQLVKQEIGMIRSRIKKQSQEMLEKIKLCIKEEFIRYKQKEQINTKII